MKTVSAANVAVTEVAPLTVTVQLPVPEQPPLQPVKLEPALATAVKVTCSPELNDAEQVAPQAMPAGKLVTVPVPVPADVTVSVFETAVAKAAVTVVDPVRETVQEVPDEEVQPVQRVNVAPLPGSLRTTSPR